MFKLYDTYGFPIDMAMEVIQEAGCSMDEAGFHAAMEAQKERARQAWVGPAASSVQGGSLSSGSDHTRGIQQTSFIGYEHLSGNALLQAILVGPGGVETAVCGDEVDLIFDATPFYSEGGGQVGDQGSLISENGRAVIMSTRRATEGIFLHRAKVTEGTLSVGARVRLEVDVATRWHTARNHTATHLLHAVLREVLGDHVKQEGSLVAPDRLRFDFFHTAPLSSHELDQIEARVNTWILQSLPVETRVMSTPEAIASGAMAFFGEKYGDLVRVVSVSDVSRELCGGTHCYNTGQIGLFKILREGSAAACVRRIEAVTGEFAYQWAKKAGATLKAVSDILKTSPEAVVDKATQLLAQCKEKERVLQERPRSATEDPLRAVQKVGSVSVLIEKIPPSDIKDIRRYADSLRDRLKSGIIIVGSTDVEGTKAFLVVMVTPEWVGRYPASVIAAQLATYIGGTGGGKAEMAQAGGKNVAMLDHALAQSITLIETLGTPEGG